MQLWQQKRTKSRLRKKLMLKRNDEQVGSSLIMPLHPEVGRVAKLFFSGRQKEAMALVAELWDLPQVVDVQPTSPLRPQTAMLGPWGKVAMTRALEELQAKAKKTPKEYFERTVRTETPISAAEFRRRGTARARQAVRAVEIINPEPLGRKTHRALAKATAEMLTIRSASVKAVDRPRKREAEQYIWWLLPKHLAEVLASDSLPESLRLKLKKLSKAAEGGWLLIGDQILRSDKGSTKYNGLTVSAAEREELHGKVKGRFMPYLAGSKKK